MIKLEPLKDSLESKPTALRVCRYLYTEFPFTKEEWGKLNLLILKTYYSVSDIPLIRKRHKRIFGSCKSKKKDFVYPLEFLPVMINIIQQFK